VREATFETGLNAQVVVDLSNALVLANSQARHLFGLDPRDIGRPFQDLEISYRPVDLRTAMEQAYSSRSVILMNEVEWYTSSGEICHFNVRIQPLLDNGDGLLGANITFIDVTEQKLLQSKLEQVNHELETSFEELQATNEELETTNEELQSTIEELETTNEELQSTNEELETMNEELQSTNEELYTINEELHQRTDELNRVNAFLEAVLLSVQAGVAVLDKELRVQVWSQMSEDLWGLRQNEVEGQNFLNLDIGLPVEQLKRSLLSCLMGETERFETILRAHNRRGKEIDCRVACNQLLGAKGEVQGLVIIMDEVEAH
jgi:two-component system CheB/CheR fusion protein